MVAKYEVVNNSFKLCFKCILSRVNVSFFRSKDSVGWELIFSTPYLENCVEKMALNAKVSSSSLGDKMLAVSSGKSLNVVTINQEQIREKGGG